MYGCGQCKRISFLCQGMCPVLKELGQVLMTAQSVLMTAQSVLMTAHHDLDA